MPKKTKRPNAEVVLQLTEEKAEPRVFLPLVMEEREKLRTILADPVFVKAWNNAEVTKPSAFHIHNEKFEGQFGPIAACNALHKIQGWELHKAALVKQTLEPIPQQKRKMEEFPDAGTIEAETKKLLEQHKK